MKFKLKGSIKEKIKAIIYLALALVIVLVLIPKDADAKKHTIKVLVATNTIDENSKIESSNIKTLEIGSYQLPSNILRAEDKDKIVGKFASAEIKKNHFIFNDDVMLKSKPKDAFLYENTEDDFIGFNTDLAKAVGGLIESGDSVKLKVYKKGDGLNNDGEVFDIPGHVKVVKVLNNAGSTVDNDKEINNKGLGSAVQSKPSVVVVEANTEQQNLITKYNNEAIIQVVLLPRGKKIESNSSDNNLSQDPSSDKENKVITQPASENNSDEDIKTEDIKAEGSEESTEGGFKVQ